jgi:hypothetical protein
MNKQPVTAGELIFAVLYFASIAVFYFASIAAVVWLASSLAAP